MADNDFHTTLGIWTEVEHSFAVIEEHLEELGFVPEEAAQFRIFCSPDDAVEYFKYPSKTSWNDIKVEVVTAYPRHMCSIVRSTEYTQ